MHTETVPYDVAGTRYCGYLAFDSWRAMRDVFDETFGEVGA